MKKRPNFGKLLRYSGIVLLILVVSFVIYSMRTTAEKADYTSYSTGTDGMKALYLLTGEMGFETGRYQKPARFLPDRTTLVAGFPQEEAINEKLEVKYLKEWMKRGNTMVIATDRESFINYEVALGLKNIKFDDGSDDGLFSGKVGNGWLILYDGGEELLNSHIGGVGEAVRFLNILAAAGNRKILFNEYYHGLTDNSIPLLDIIGQTGRLVLLQIFLALAALIILLWRRFGKPVEVFEIIKRKENENMQALSNLYIRSKADDLVLETHFRSFRTELAKYLGAEASAGETELSRLADKDVRLRKRHTGALIGECSQFIREGRKNTRQMLHLIEKMEDIRKEIE